MYGIGTVTGAPDTKPNIISHTQGMLYQGEYRYNKVDSWKIIIH